MAQVAVDTKDGGGSVKTTTERDPSRGKFEFDNAIKDFGAAAWDAAKRDFGTVTKDISDGWNKNVVQPWNKYVAEPVMGAVDAAGKWCEARVNDVADFGSGAWSVVKGVGQDLSNAWKSFTGHVGENYNKGVEENRARRNGIATPTVQDPSVGEPEMG